MGHGKRYRKSGAPFRRSRPDYPRLNRGILGRNNQSFDRHQLWATRRTFFPLQNGARVTPVDYDDRRLLPNLPVRKTGATSLYPRMLRNERAGLRLTRGRSAVGCR